MHTDKEKDLLRRYLTEHWMRLEEEYFRPLRPTDLLNLDHLKVSGGRSWTFICHISTTHRQSLSKTRLKGMLLACLSTGQTMAFLQEGARSGEAEGKGVWWLVSMRESGSGRPSSRVRGGPGKEISDTLLRF